MKFLGNWELIFIFSASFSCSTRPVVPLQMSAMRPSLGSFRIRNMKFVKWGLDKRYVSRPHCCDHIVGRLASPFTIILGEGSFVDFEVSTRKSSPGTPSKENWVCSPLPLTIRAYTLKKELYFIDVLVVSTKEFSCGQHWLRKKRMYKFSRSSNFNGPFTKQHN